MEFLVLPGFGRVPCESHACIILLYIHQEKHNCWIDGKPGIQIGVRLLT